MKAFELIKQKSYEIEHAGEKWQVIQDADILDLAEKLRLPPSKVAYLSTSANVLPLRYLKNIGAITIKQQAILCDTKILVAGCGGLGGTLIHLALRIGFGTIRCVDPDRFEAANANRQWFHFSGYEGMPKVDAIAKESKKINPLVTVEPVRGKLNLQHLKGIQIVLDGLDNPSDRLDLDGWCKERKIPFVHGAVRGIWGQIHTILPDAESRLEAIYSNLSDNRQQGKDSSLEEKYGILAHTVTLVASLQISEAVKLALGFPPSFSKHLLYVDLEQAVFLKVPLDSIT